MWVVLAGSVDTVVSTADDGLELMFGMRASSVYVDMDGGTSMYALAQRYNVAPVTIKDVVLRHTWKHVP